MSATPLQPACPHYRTLNRGPAQHIVQWTRWRLPAESRRIATGDLP